MESYSAPKILYIGFFDEELMIEEVRRGREPIFLISNDYRSLPKIIKIFNPSEILAIPDEIKYIKNILPHYPIKTYNPKSGTLRN